MKDKMWPHPVQNMPFSISKNSKNIKVAKEKTLRIKFDVIDFVWENGFDTQIGK